MGESAGEEEEVLREGLRRENVGEELGSEYVRGMKMVKAVKRKRHGRYSLVISVGGPGLGKREMAD